MSKKNSLIKIIAFHMAMNDSIGEGYPYCKQVSFEAFLSNPKRYEDYLDASEEAKQAIIQWAVSNLPPRKSQGRVAVTWAQAYNQALDDMKKALEEA